MTEITLENGKYTVVNELSEGGGLHALRYGEKWRDLAGDGLVLSMFHEIECLREGLTSIADGASSVDSPDQLADTAKYYLEGRTD